MAKTTKTATATKTTEDKLAQFEAALLQAVKAGVLNGAAIDAAIVKAGFNVADEEHAACKPVSATEAAMAALAEFGLDVAELATSKALAVNLDALARAVGKYGKHAVIFSKENGTSACTHYMLNELAKNGRVTLAETLAFVRQFKPTYSSAGHYNTIKRLLKAAGYELNVSQGAFSIKA